jgi:hypothetical protein
MCRTTSTAANSRSAASAIAAMYDSKVIVSSPTCSHTTSGSSEARRSRAPGTPTNERYSPQRTSNSSLRTVSWHRREEWRHSPSRKTPGSACVAFRRHRPRLRWPQRHRTASPPPVAMHGQSARLPPVAPRPDLRAPRAGVRSRAPVHGWPACDERDRRGTLFRLRVREMWTAEILTTGCLLNELSVTT